MGVMQQSFFPELFENLIIYAVSFIIQQECILVNNQLAGVCCRDDTGPPAEIKKCPVGSVCLPGSFCFGDAYQELGNSGAFYPYDFSDAPWRYCTVIGDDSVDPGICCQNAKQVDLLPADHCGVANPNLDTRITLSYDRKNQANFGEFPWQGIIFFSNYTFKCGAALISHDYAVSASHCLTDIPYFKSTGQVKLFNPSDLRLRFGEWQVNVFDEPLNYIDYDILHIYTHPNFDRPVNVRYNLALLKLDRPVEFQYHINTVCLPPAGRVFREGTRCWATGWGKDGFLGDYQNIMKKVDLPIIGEQLCYDWASARLGRRFHLHESLICAGGEEGKDTCTGDGGGPLVCQNPDTGYYELAGITSGGLGCGGANLPGFYANVAFFIPWLESIVFLDQNPHQQEQASSSYGKK